MAHSAARRGRTLKLYLVDGTASGVILAELGISSVRALVSSRTTLPELLSREETQRTGIYILVGPDPLLPDRLLAYVGEGDQVRARLIAHDSDESKDFFKRVVLIVSKDENLTKAHGRYLESRLLAAARASGRARLANNTAPPFRGLPEPEIADMERVLDEIDVLLPVLGFDILRKAGQEGGAPEQNDADEAQEAVPKPQDALFVFKEAGTSARAREAADEFVVLAGSLVRLKETLSCPEGARQRRAQAIADGDLIPEGNALLRCTADIAFDSPSGAGSFVYGGAINGRHFWRHESELKSYGDWRKARMPS